MEFVNLTGKIIRLNDGRKFLPSAHVVKVELVFSDTEPRFIPEEYKDLRIVSLKKVVVGLPVEDDSRTLLVEKDVLDVIRSDRGDVIAPAYGHPDCVVKNGEVFSVPGFIW